MPTENAIFKYGVARQWAASTTGWRNVARNLESRSVIHIADAILNGAAALRRVEVARTLGVAVPTGAGHPDPVRS